MKLSINQFKFQNAELKKPSLPLTSIRNQVDLKTLLKNRANENIYLPANIQV